MNDGDIMLYTELHENISRAVFSCIRSLTDIEKLYASIAFDSVFAGTVCVDPIGAQCFAHLGTTTPVWQNLS
jgi:hypothetical protein